LAESLTGFGIVTGVPLKIVDLLRDQQRVAELLARVFFPVPPRYAGISRPRMV